MEMNRFAYMQRGIGPKIKISSRILLLRFYYAQLFLEIQLF